MLNDTSVASAGSYIRTCRRIRNSKKIATIRDFHQNICVNPTKSYVTTDKYATLTFIIIIIIIIRSIYVLSCTLISLYNWSQLIPL